MKTRLAALAGLMLVGEFALAQQPSPGTLAEVKANGRRLKAEEVRGLVTGTKTTHVSSRGSTRIWDNGPDGKLTASSDGHGELGRSYKGFGTWQIKGDGAYCVNIEWQRSKEDWCRYLFKIGDKYFGVGSLRNEAAVANELSFSK